ncbi:hypothetical protein P8C59_009056 [Phyllachora maydis]|uniref:Uncharacterized protein n=1 Tax=Phyllachora maydis TaxID=1825666 RepID=A0AAD9IBQ0_9PEZI|nr:hypothetical protein P8C59_009056 [Phyllachora maydis]
MMTLGMFDAAGVAAIYLLDREPVARSPHWDDVPWLPYVNAFVQEVFRWRSVAVIGGQPHSPTRDDRYCGWLPSRAASTRAQRGRRCGDSSSIAGAVPSWGSRKAGIAINSAYAEVVRSTTVQAPNGAWHRCASTLRLHHDLNQK